VWILKRAGGDGRDPEVGNPRARSRIDQLEKLVAHMKAKPGVWFATVQQIAHYIKRGGSRSTNSLDFVTFGEEGA
jgi:hypothetical protein